MNIKIAILASGKATRFKSNKLMYEIDGIPMIEKVFQSVQNINCEVVVITRFNQIIELANKYSYSIIMNNHYELGISESVKLAVSYFNKSDGILFMMGDQPFIHPNSIKKMIHQADESNILRAKVCDKISTPTLFPKKYFKELIEIIGDEGGRSVIRKYPNHIKYIEFENIQELIDIDQI